MFVIVGKDTAGQFTGVVGKLAYDTQSAAEDHAKSVLGSNGTQVSQFFIFELTSIVQRTSPPIEVVQLKEAYKPEQSAPLKRYA